MPFLSSIWFKIGAIVIALGLVYAAYNHFVDGVKEGQKTEDQNIVYKQALEDIETLKKKTDALDEAQSAIIIQLNKKNETVITKQETVRTYLQSEEARKSDRPSSDVIKETVRKLSNEE
jgi:2,4-dienoyl-CoA reductase-like NADH-dependent reductase (Old Yellow Enzyme family)